MNSPPPLPQRGATGPTNPVMATTTPRDDSWRRRRRRSSPIEPPSARMMDATCMAGSRAEIMDEEHLQTATARPAPSTSAASFLPSTLGSVLGVCILFGALLDPSAAFHQPFPSSLQHRSIRSRPTAVPRTRPAVSELHSSVSNEQSSKKRTSPTNNNRGNKKKTYKKKRKYSRKLPLSASEKAAALNRRKRRAAYEKMRSTSLEISNEPPSIWSFDALFPAPVLDEKSVREDLFGSKEREEEMRGRQLEMEKMKEQKRLEMERQEKAFLVEPETSSDDNVGTESGGDSESIPAASTQEKDLELTRQTIMKHVEETDKEASNDAASNQPQPPQFIDKTLTRMVEDRLYGLTRSPAGSIQYSTSLLDSNRAVQFREGVRLGKALTINIDRLCHFAKKDIRKGRLEEAQGHYMEALQMDPTDGRPYLGLSRIAERRGDLKEARALLKKGIHRSSGGHVVVRGPGKVAVVAGKKSKRSKQFDPVKSDVDFEEEDGKTIGTIPDVGPNPFLLQALGTLEQKLGNLAAAEELYLQAIRSRPSHAAAWVALAQLRTKELRQGASAGRTCYQSAERELMRIGAKPNAHVYTAWASMEYKKGSSGGSDDDIKSLRRARELYQKALAADPNCSVAYLQLGVMESECGNFDTARECFEEVLKFDQRNSRVLQAYAIMESRRPMENVDSRRVLDLFERALKVNPRDAAVYQAYALYVVELGDVDSARDLLRRGTEVNKRHAPVWPAWGVLETRYSTAKNARDVFQQGIWACAQPGGGQSGGRRCARLWQAWGVLEAQEGDHAAARRCFSRALDADQRNIASVTAWTLMEAELGNFADARSIFERTLRLFRTPSADKTAIWRAYEVMEERAGNTQEAQMVFQRSMRESMERESSGASGTSPDVLAPAAATSKRTAKKSREVEFSRWETGSNELDAEVWLNDGAVEGKVPPSMMKKLKNRR